MDENIEQLDWCAYCKEPIYQNDDWVRVKKRMYHLACYELMKDEMDE